jgi:hypothetical protein
MGRILVRDPADLLIEEIKSNIGVVDVGVVVHPRSKLMGKLTHPEPAASEKSIRQSSGHNHGEHTLNQQQSEDTYPIP